MNLFYPSSSVSIVDFEQVIVYCVDLLIVLCARIFFFNFFIFIYFFAEKIDRSNIQYCISLLYLIC